MMNAIIILGAALHYYINYDAHVILPVCVRALHHHQQLSKSKKDKKDKIKNWDGRTDPVATGIFPILIRYTGISIRNLKRGRRVA